MAVLMRRTRRDVSEVLVNCAAANDVFTEKSGGTNRLKKALDSKGLVVATLGRITGGAYGKGPPKRKFQWMQEENVKLFGRECEIDYTVLCVKEGEYDAVPEGGLKAFAPNDTDRLAEPPAVSTIAPSGSSQLSDTLPNRIAKYAIALIAVAIISLLALGLSRELGFSHSVRFPVLSELNVIDLVGGGVAWIPPLPILVSLPILWLFSRRRTIAVPWALIVGAMLFGSLAASAHELVSRKDLDVYAVGLAGFLACLAVTYHARTRKMSRALVFGAVMVAALSAATLDGVAEGAHAKGSLNFHDIHLRGEKQPTVVSVLRSYRNGILVVMPIRGVGGRYRSEVAFLPYWRVCSLSEFHLEPDQGVCS